MVSFDCGELLKVAKGWSLKGNRQEPLPYFEHKAHFNAASSPHSPRKQHPTKASVETLFRLPPPRILTGA